MSLLDVESSLYATHHAAHASNKKGTKFNGIKPISLWMTVNLNQPPTLNLRFSDDHRPTASTPRASYNLVKQVIRQHGRAYA